MASLVSFEFKSVGFARTVGTAHLFLAGATNVATGVILVRLALSGRLLSAAIARIGRYVTPATALQYGDLLALATTGGALVVGIALAGLGILGCTGVYGFVHGRWSRRRELVLAACNGVNPLALPLAFVAVVLLAVSPAETPLDGPTDDSTVGDDDYAGGSTDRS